MKAGLHGESLSFVGWFCRHVLITELLHLPRAEGLCVLCREEVGGVGGGGWSEDRQVARARHTGPRGEAGAGTKGAVGHSRGEEGRPSLLALQTSNLGVEVPLPHLLLQGHDHLHGIVQDP